MGLLVAITPADERRDAIRGGCNCRPQTVRRGGDDWHVHEPSCVLTTAAVDDARRSASVS